MAKEANLRLIELHWKVVGPVTPQFNVAQPWVKGYNGEVSPLHIRSLFYGLDPCLDRPGSEAGDGLLSQPLRRLLKESLRDSTS